MHALSRYGFYVAWLLLLGYLLFVFSEIAWLDTISSVANDSVNYLVMARHYTLWVAEPAANRLAWPAQDFPPLFPLFLALTGAAYDFLWAHVLVTLLGLASLFLFYRFINQTLGARKTNLVLVILLGLSPGFVLGVQGILSEPLYLLITLIFFCWHGVLEEKNPDRQLLLLGLLVGLAIQTRTIGYALLLAVLVHYFLSAFKDKTNFRDGVLIAFMAALSSLLISWLVGPKKESHYQGVLENFLRAGDETTLSYYLNVLSQQAVEIFSSWTGFWLLYWVEGRLLTHFVVWGVLGLSVAGLVYRLLKNRLDAWYVLMYLAVLLVWPHPGQMLRLLFPVVPFLLVYAFVIAKWVSIHLPIKHAGLTYSGVLGALVLMTVLPVHGFLHGRIQLVDSQQAIPVYEVFRRLDAREALTEAEVQTKMLVGFSRVGELVDDKQRVLSFVPEYLVVFGGLYGEALVYDAGDIGGKEMLREADYVYITKIHPRMSRKGYDGFVFAEYMKKSIVPVWCNSMKESAAIVSCLYKVR